MRMTGIRGMVIFGPATPEERPIIAEHGFIPTISGLEEAEAFDRLKRVAVNFKIDTGMRRLSAMALAKAGTCALSAKHSFHQIQTSSKAPCSPQQAALRSPRC